MFVQVLTKGPVTVFEGGAVEYIELSATLPPRFICATSENLASAKGTCEITVFGFLGIESGDRKCMDGTTIPQAVIGWPHSYDDDIIVPCGIKVTESNWFKVLRLAVKAKVDLINDTSYTRKLTISQKASVGTVQITTELKIIEVGVFRFSLATFSITHFLKINRNHITIVRKCAFKYHVYILKCFQNCEFASCHLLEKYGNCGVVIGSTNTVTVKKFKICII